jgi:peptide/nickel transport system substrate-binding protein
MRIRKSTLFLMATFMAFLAVLSFTGSAVLAAPPQGVLKEAIHWSISADWFDPAITGNYMSIFNLSLIHDALLKPMPEGTYVPCLAESWEISPDAKVYEFRLRKGVKFHNGDEMTAEDVVFSFWRYKGMESKFIHGRTEKVEMVTPYLVRITFKVPFPDFLDYHLSGITTIGWVVPKKYIERVGDAGFKKNPIGCGPYKFVEFVPGVKLVGEAFEEYWRKTPSIKRMEFYTVSEPATRLAMVRRGEVDIATLLQGIFYEDVKKDPSLRLVHPISPVHWLVYMGGQWDPKSPWSDARVRKAASLAIDRKALADIHMPGCGPVGTLALEGDPSGVNFPPDPYDPEQARKLLAEAGYPKGFDGGKYYPYQGGYWPYGEQIATYWKAVGITVETVLLDRPAWIANRQGGRMKGVLFFDPAPRPTIGGRLAYLLGPTSYGNYPDIQAIWDQYQREVDLNVRKELIGRIQKMIYERTMFIPLTNTNSPAALGPRVKGNPYKIQPLIWFTTPFEDIELVK